MTHCSLERAIAIIIDQSRSVYTCAPVLPRDTEFAAWQCGDNGVMITVTQARLHSVNDMFSARTCITSVDRSELFHSIPLSENEKYRLPPTTTWSRKRMPMMSAISLSLRVISMSSGLGAGSPAG